MLPPSSAERSGMLLYILQYQNGPEQQRIAPNFRGAQGAWDMWRAYSDMREANYIGADKYFHARGNYDAAQRGPGGAWAAKVISDARENSQRVTDFFRHGSSGHGAEDSKADQEANEWGRSGKDPNHFRPAGLPEKY
ncbi:serum amyloid A protein-like isoform X1 [Prionailurus bengalensis]|uniref:serum amyloid A protein-like isoform X1 n=2 Tax=Prionailurus bengalensis TaxID=37029 RepID=UPI001CA8DF7C|nr:serum amyloid A protein-like isoform X1 [Prionailurus bengalensis]